MQGKECILRTRWRLRRSSLLSRRSRGGYRCEQKHRAVRAHGAGARPPSPQDDLLRPTSRGALALLLTLMLRGSRWDCRAHTVLGCGRPSAPAAPDPGRGRPAVGARGPSRPHLDLSLVLSLSFLSCEGMLRTQVVFL